MTRACAWIALVGFAAMSGGAPATASAESMSDPVASARKKPKKATRTKKPRKARRPGRSAQPPPTDADPVTTPTDPTSASIEPAATPAPAPTSPIVDAAAAPRVPSVATSPVSASASPTGALSTTKRSHQIDASPARIRLGVESGPFWRQLRYKDAINGDLRQYDLAAGSIGIELALRPLARFGLELGATAEMAVGVNGSRSPEMDVYPTRSSEWQGTIAYVVGARALQARFAVGLGEHRFVVDDAMSPDGELVPDTTYRFVRGGASVGYQLHRRVNVAGGAGWRQLIETGGLTSAAWFPRATGNGIDASLGIEVALTRTLRAHVRGEVRRYFFAMHPEVGDVLIVGGALDQYVGVTAGLTLGVL